MYERPEIDFKYIGPEKIKNIIDPRDNKRGLISSTDIYLLEFINSYNDFDLDELGKIRNG